jgi:BASS family bile acid:Na+ symporter
MVKGRPASEDRGTSASIRARVRRDGATNGRDPGRSMNGGWRRIGAGIESNLLVLVVVTTAVGLLVPPLGAFLADGIAPLLALLMLLISLSFDLGAVRLVLSRPTHQLVALLLVYGPMSLVGLATGRLFFGAGPLATGQTLVGTLPTDVSAPLLVLLARGNVARTAVLNAINTALSPFIVPALFLALTGVELQFPSGL